MKIMLFNIMINSKPDIIVLHYTRVIIEVERYYLPFNRMRKPGYYIAYS